MICRKISNKQLFAERCRDTASDHRGFIVYLDDEDLRSLVARRPNAGDNQYGLLKERFDRLIM